MKVKITPKVFFLIFLFISSFCYAQNETNNWYFGANTGLNFNSIPPTLLNDSSMDQLEGSSSISDANGNLLFYSDGRTVWNKNHDIMSNGTGLLGNESSSQSALIIPIPENDSLYYIFTAPLTVNSNNAGIRYSLVNIHSNGGHGEVVQKNILLLTLGTEKLAAILHCNNKDIWVVVTEYNTNNFYAFSITKDGICDCPVISSVGQIQTETQGHLKFSPGGSRLVAVMPFLDTELFSFDRNSGNVTFLDAIPGTNNNSGQVSSSFYGASFSPDNSKLYVSSGWWSALDNGCAKVVQYDLDAPDLNLSQTIIFDNSIEGQIGNCQSGGLGALQLGRDGIIYIASWGYEYLHTIISPNNPGVDCEFIEDGFHLNGLSGRLGLPNFIESYFDTSDSVTVCTPTILEADFTYIDSCSQQNIPIHQSVFFEFWCAVLFLGFWRSIIS